MTSEKDVSLQSLSHNSQYKADTENIINKGPHTKIGFAYYFPKDNNSNNLELVKNEDELNERSRIHFKEYINETLRDKEVTMSNQNEKEPYNEFDRSFYTNRNKENPIIYSQENVNYRSYVNHSNKNTTIWDNTYKYPLVNKKIILSKNEYKYNLQGNKQTEPSSTNLDTLNTIKKKLPSDNSLSSSNSNKSDEINSKKSLFSPQLQIQSTQLKFLPRYFVIKSIDEDNIHKSIKYKIWCSTPKGNLKLNKAYKESNGNPIYLFFSVNGSGRFLGVAQMTSEIDLNSNFNYWSQSKKWRGFFCVVWLIIKDIPNRAFNNIFNEYNENKPVSSSRDTQEISQMAGAEMLRIFHDFNFESSILDDFEYYEIKQQKIENINEKYKGEIVDDNKNLQRYNECENNPDQIKSPSDVEQEFSYLKINSIHDYPSNNYDKSKSYNELNSDNRQSLSPQNLTSNLESLQINHNSVKRILRKINEI